MADNVPITPGSGTNVAADDVGGVLYQRLKPSIGDDGAAQDVSYGNPMPSAPGRPTAAGMNSAQISANASGDNTLLAGTASQTIRMMGGFLQNTGAAPVSIRFCDGAAATPFHPAITLQPGGSWTLDRDGEPWFVTSVATALVLNLSAAVQVSGRFYYTKS